MPADFTDFRILIVDDQEANLNALATVLGFAGYTRLECLSDSRRILPVFAAFGPDLILLDLHMPHVDGLEAMDQLAAVINEDDYLPILVLTGDVTAHAKEKALSHGAKDFLSKPLSSTEVQLRVRNLLQTRYLHLQLRARNESLEQQVRERTHLAGRLAQSNQALEETNRRLATAQVQLIQTEKMASLGQLVAGIAHEVNNPLSFVLNHLFIVESGLNRISPEMEPHLAEPSLRKLRRLGVRLGEMREGLDRVKELVLQLRTFSRLDEGGFKTADVTENIDSVLLFLKHKMNGRIRVEKHYGPVRALYCCAGRLNQVLMNLVANAIDAIAGPGKIAITTGQADDVFFISVRDTGAGIPEGIRTRIFDPFFTTKAVGKGTGLGLAISYGIVQDHLGSIEVQSQEGQGSEFHIRIPVDLESRIRQ
jgi:two-component system NtrC family sensor kinase